MQATAERSPPAARAGDIPLLEVRDVIKTFPGVKALDGVQFKLRPGTVHALMGENGAGKSTLMKIIAGVYIPDGGELLVKGQPLTLKGPLDALDNGIAMIHQELNLMAYMTIAENIWIRREPLTRLGFVDHREMRKRTQALFDRLNIDLNPEAEVRSLSIANRQMVEIAKAVSFDSDVLIMDEPTSAITEREVEHLFRIIRDLKAQGKGIVYITHKMNELFEIADEVSVFRDGRYIETKLSSEVTRDDIIKMMVGREITQMFPKEEVPIGDIVLSIKDLAVEGVFSGINFDLRAGEILGLAGLVGSGRSNVAEAIFGVVPATSGSMAIRGTPVVIDSPATAMKNGMAFLTEDRKETGCFLTLGILANMDTAVLSSNYVKFGFVQGKRLMKDCDALSKTLRVKTPNLHEPIQNLSGGNQQKALIGRWLLTRPKILILDEPTRGIDVGAKAEIHRLISKLAGEGVAVLMISSELPEVLGMSDRVVVMHQGHQTGIVDRKDADQVTIMDLASQ
ncbi:sugar ABC transporter ATP-binding protein [Paraburkholderia rhynchosiae]|uniref:Ribose/galactose/methyl galactoside import ATP-binding protein n=1 Tax=Paraburkholderia rhynchosiae TaxID=487049 RepID=A0A2N7VP12_9BURK|nr:sugar ABC transporter ATP-binding protein [Paraburkholderia rhynchosiae]PMS18909.1 D-xylose ABC transporter ATP-binding protein [Paraburkholderia rhynchosiae]CAB3743441.1 Galactose/methyl galactoside import ATP-binding protein MglA [Paraburkholderia rhynchosiae]